MHTTVVKSPGIQQVQCSTMPVRVRTTVKLLRHNMLDFIIAPNLWFLTISDFSPVDYRILEMLQK